MFSANDTKIKIAEKPAISLSAITSGEKESVLKHLETGSSVVTAKIVHAGFYIELLEDHCEHYAVIDNKIVWYGSMNLLSKDDLEDNIMRVVDKNIAAELLEMTFQKGNHLQDYQLPI